MKKATSASSATVLVATLLNLLYLVFVSIPITTTLCHVWIITSIFCFHLSSASNWDGNQISILAKLNVCKNIQVYQLHCVWSITDLFLLIHTADLPRITTHLKELKEVNAGKPAIFTAGSEISDSATLTVGQFLYLYVYANGVW